MKSIKAKAILPMLLIALALLVTACDQGSAAGPSAPAVKTQTNSGSTAAPATGMPTEVTSTDATADVHTGQGGLDLMKVDPCKLLTQDEVKSAMGNVPYAPKPLSQESYHTACSYVEPTLEVDSPRLFLSLDPAEMWEMHSTDAQVVSGIGDEAYSINYNGWRTLSVLLRNKVTVSIDIFPPDLEKAKELTSKAIGRLP